MSSYLPEELVVKILSKLPPKSLIRFRCVSKAWYSLIGIPDFFSRNLLNDSILITHNPNHSHLLVKATTEESDAQKIVFSLLSYNTLNYVSRTPLPLTPGLEFVASCKGLLCLYNTQTGEFNLWNPATPSDFKALPPPPVPPHFRIIGSCFGFGFDSRCNDFKVIRLNLLLLNQAKTGRKLKSSVEIYNLSGGSWRVVELPKVVCAPPGFQSCSRTLSLDGFSMWWLGDHNIVSFDFSKEEVQTTPLPDDIHLRLLSVDGGDCNDNSTISLLNGHVALLAFSGSKMNTKCWLDIWILLEFGVEDSWTRLTTLGLPMDLERPLGFWKRGELFMENSEGQLVLYDPFTRTTRNLQVDAIKETFQIVLHTPSSVAVNP